MKCDCIVGEYYLPMADKRIPVRKSALIKRPWEIDKLNVINIACAECGMAINYKAKRDNSHPLESVVREIIFC